jgi:hypothetical protein
MVMIDIFICIDIYQGFLLWISIFYIVGIIIRTIYNGNISPVEDCCCMLLKWDMKYITNDKWIKQKQILYFSDMSSNVLSYKLL